ncbi:MAG: shikimate dehydrogenase [gamma proteobacterium symbiont of Bathyaustriella thionipta]|nr:shikimate dehydrogenase [gamma proteobacterium symbiont of Bathyaustriella thionipta]
MSQKPDRYAVIGNPIAHSKSPQIHSAFAEQSGELLEYTRILGEKENFAHHVHDFIRNSGRGLNVTVPFKQDAWQLVNEHIGSAALAGAVNTIILTENGQLQGANTDGIGLVRDLANNHEVELAGKDILILGAGGASRGILAALLEQQPAHVLIANRTASKAQDMALEFQSLGEISGSGLQNLKSQNFDIIINATSAGLNDRIPDIPDTLLRQNGVCYDLMYADKATAFVRWGQQHKARLSLDGLGMLVEQAAESFFLWRGVHPQTAPVIKMLRP